jgi:hypothetical protein
MTATISRYKQPRSRFATGPGYAWYWGYTVTLSTPKPGQPSHDMGRGLESARSWAKRQGATEIVETWKAGQ